MEYIHQKLKNIFFIHAYSVRMYEWNNFYFNCCNCSSILYWLKLRWFYVYFDLIINLEIKFYLKSSHKFYTKLYYVGNLIFCLNQFLCLNNIYYVLFLIYINYLIFKWFYSLIL